MTHEEELEKAEKLRGLLREALNMIWVPHFTSVKNCPEFPGLTKKEMVDLQFELERYSEILHEFIHPDGCPKDAA